MNEILPDIEPSQTQIALTAKLLTVVKLMREIEIELESLIQEIPYSKESLLLAVDCQKIARLWVIDSLNS